MNTNTQIHRAGSVEMTEADIQAALSEGKEYIISHRKIYHVQQTRGGGYRFPEVYRKRGGLPIMVRGRYQFATPETAAKLSNGFIHADAWTC